MTQHLTRRSALALLGGAFAGLAGCSRNRPSTVIVGSKNFTEQIVLAELLAQQIEAHSMLRVERRLNLGGTLICQQAMLAGQMDLYAEYTGTALAAILGQPASHDAAAVYRAVHDAYRDRFGFDVGPPLGFNNTFAIVVRGEDAKSLNLRTISDLVPVAPHWRAGFGYEFMERSDGYPGLASAYGLKFAAAPSIMDLGLLYRALKEHKVDVVAGNSTDGLIVALGMTVLEDDRNYFPPYQAVTVVRVGTLQAHPELRGALDALGGKISDSEMRQMNYAVDGDQRDPAEVAREFLARGIYDQIARAYRRLLKSRDEEGKKKAGGHMTPISQELLDLLVCPVCKTPVKLTEDQQGLHCTTCRIVYPVRDGFPVMIREEAHPES